MSQTPAGVVGGPSGRSRDAGTSAPRPDPAYWLAALAVWSLLCVVLGGGNVASVDLWGRLSMPAVWLATGRFPYRDHFSYTMQGQPWTDHEWGAGFVFYAALWLGGEAGLTLVKWLAAAVMVGAVFAAARLRGISPHWPLVILLAGLPVLEIAFLTTARPQIFTFALYPVVIGLLEATRGDGRWARLVWLGPVSLVWGNLHGGFVAGVGLPLLYAAGSALSGDRMEPRRGLPYAAATGWSLLGSVVNPYGWRYWPYMWTTLNHSRVVIDEWQPVPWAGLDYLAVKALALVAVGAMVLAGRRVLAARGSERAARREAVGVPALVLLVLLVLGFRHVKHLPLLVIGAAVYLPLIAGDPVAGWWQRASARVRTARPRLSSLGQALTYGLPLGLALAALLHLALLLPRVDPLRIAVHAERDADEGLRLPVYPVAAIRFLQASPYGGRLFTPFNWGQFAYWVLYPRFVVALDGRYDSVYDVETVERLNAFYTTGGLDWEVPARSRADFVLLDRDYLAATSGRSARPAIPPAWVVLYENPKFMVLGERAAIARARSAPPGPPGDAAGDRPATVSSFWDPAGDLIRFAGYGAAAVAGRGPVDSGAGRSTID